MGTVSKAIDEVRANEAKQPEEGEYEPVLERSRWVLLKRPENLSGKQAASLSGKLRNLSSTSLGGAWGHVGAVALGSSPPLIMQDHTYDLGDALAEHGPFLTRLSRSLLRDSHAAEDLVQDTWLAALEKRPGRDASAGGWLSRTLRNRAISGFRRRAVRRSATPIDGLDVDSGVAAAAPTPAETAEKLEAQRLVHAALTGLSEPRRTTLTLRFQGGLTVPDIARRMEVPVPTVKSRLASGLSELRQGLDAEFGGGDQGRRAWGALLVPVATTRLPGEAAALVAGSNVAVQAASLGGGGLGGGFSGGLGLFLAACGTALLVAVGWRAMDKNSALGAGPGSPDTTSGARDKAESRMAGLAPLDSLPGEQVQGLPETSPVGPSRMAAKDQPSVQATSAAEGSGPYGVLRDPNGRAVEGMKWGTTFNEPTRTYREDDDWPVTDELGRAWLPPQGPDIPEVLWRPWHVFPIAPLVPTLATMVEVTSTGATDVPVPLTAPLEVTLLDGAGAPWQGPALVRLYPKDQDYCAPHYREVRAGEPLRWPHVGRGVPYTLHVKWLGDWNSVLIHSDGIGASESERVHQVRITNRRVVLVGRLVDPRGAALGDVGFLRRRRHVRSDANGYVRIPLSGEPILLAGTEVKLTGAVGGAHWNADGLVKVPNNVAAGDVDVGDIVMVERPVTVSGRLVTAEGEGLPHRDLKVLMRNDGGEWKDSGVRMMSAKDGSFLLTKEVGAGTEELSIQVERATFLERTYVLKEPIPFDRGARQVEVRMEPTAR